MTFFENIDAHFPINIYSAFSGHGQVAAAAIDGDEGGLKEGGKKGRVKRCRNRGRVISKGKAWLRG